MRKYLDIKVWFFISAMVLLGCKEKAVTENNSIAAEPATNEVAVSGEDAETAEITEVSAPAWPMPDYESIKVPISDQQWRFCSYEGVDYIITFTNGLRTDGMLYFEILNPTDDNMNKVTGVFTAEYKSGGEITVKKPVDCADCSEDYMTGKFRFDEDTMQLIVKDENGNTSSLEECMLSM